MLENAQRMLRNGYTIFISNKDNERLVGTYLKKFERGIRVHELDQEELNPIRMLPNIMAHIMNGEILQFHQEGRFVIANMGEKKTEGAYCEKEYLEVREQLIGDDYHNLLIDLDIRLASKQTGNTLNAMQYKKLYKGVERYE